MEAKLQRLIELIPYGKVPLPLTGTFPEIEPDLSTQIKEMTLKPNFTSHIISQLDRTGEMFELSNLDETPRHCKGCTCQTISNYPTIKRGEEIRRDGDPTADAYAFWRCRNFVVFSVNDGCGWGVEPSYAARVASATFVLYVKNEFEKNMEKYKTTEDLKNLCQTAIALAHQTIVDLELAEGKNPGTCTVCAGVLVPIIPDDVFEKKNIQSEKYNEIHDTSSEIAKIADEYLKNVTKKTKMDEKYQLIGVSFGDCKTFYLKKGEDKTFEVNDLTFGSRLKALNPNDPGGRIGFQKRPSRLIDMRNNIIFHQIMNWDDMIMVCSDGVHDNLEPKTRGYRPVEVKPELGDIKWFKLKAPQIEEMNKEFSLKFIKEMAEHSVSVHQLHQIIMDAVVGVVTDRKQYMADHPDENVPDVLTGKLDHATLLLCRPTY